VELLLKLKMAAHGLARSLGFELHRYPPPDFLVWPDLLDARANATIEAVRPFTMTSPERIYALCQAVRYVVRHAIPGDIAECGVWKGGSMLAVARTLIECGDTSRELYLYDTYEGMTEPRDVDVELFGGQSAAEIMAADGRDAAGHSLTAHCPLDLVREVMASSGYPGERIHYVKGPVEETLPESAPGRLAILRLDTDWYESTRHELETLFPRISPFGVLVIDDYGQFQGARKAVDEYLERCPVPILLNRIDPTGRIAIVPPAA
jgi:hypothetical protein